MSLLVVGLVVSDAVVLATLRGPLLERVDLQLRLASGVLSRIPEPLVRRLEGRALTDPAGDPDTDPATDSAREGLDDLYIAFLDRDGAVELEWRGERAPELDRDTVLAHGDQPFEVPGWRVLAAPTGAGAVVVAGSLDQVDATIAGVRLVCVLVGAGVLVVLAVAGWFWVRAGLAPLRRIEETAAAIAGGDLSRRVPGAPPRTEVGRLTTSLNGMLTQIEHAVDARARSEARMRRFVADASHELRTPLAGISGFAELYRMGAAEVDATMDRIERESVRLAGLVDDLLLLAQLDEGQHDLVRAAPMDLRTLAVDALHDLRALDPTREITLTGPDGAPEPGPAPVLGEESRLRRVVTNLVGNAVAHTPAGSPVRVGVGTTGTDAVLEIADSGPGMSAEQARLVFDRFYRADTSRARDGGGGAGLGLAIAWSLVTAHGGSIELDTAPGRGATFRVRMPIHGDRA
ncbi:two-component sensor histidine kinase [Actinophytocola xanthii]|uniref:histidine kinase n=2 Tax=Actinophytocola xanthii TaxID=1912961 RepID=A0A1Q8C1L4_9PSEU|nr:two-component sensor histidine kinase [Actinophytocola xanthii]